MKFELLKKYVEQCHELGKDVTFIGIYHYRMAFK